jgi:mono/diheme cytochrome c family protein
MRHDEIDQQDRARVERRREGDRRFFLALFAFLVGLFALGLIGVVYVLASNGLGTSEGSDGQPAATHATTTTETRATATPTQPPAGSGRNLFVSTCGSCHTLAAAGTTGTVGPNLDDVAPDQETVQAAIQDGPGVMPAGLLTGAQAHEVAAFVAASTGH